MKQHRRYRLINAPRRGQRTRERAWCRRIRLHLEGLEIRLAPATFNVNSTADILSPPPGTITLRSAIQSANTNSDASNTINLTLPGTYAITLPGTPGEVDNAAGEFAIFSTVLATGVAKTNLNIVNTSGGAATVDAGRLARVFDANPSLQVGSVNITAGGAGFTGASGITFSAPALAGGIQATGTLIVNAGMVVGVTITNPGTGYTTSAPPTITFTGPGAGAAGNIVLASPKIIVSMSGFTIQNGLAQPGDLAAGSGGGIRELGNANLTLTNMVVTSNSASADGGGIAAENSSAGTDFLGGSTTWTLTINNSTISNNHAGDAGGGVEEDGSGTVNITAGSTISGNTDVNQGAGVYLDGIGNAVTRVSVTGGGFGYTSAPIVNFGGPGTGAAGFATVSGGMVTSVTMTNSGTGYTSAPTITFVGGGGSGAAATATVVANQSANLTMTGTLVSGNTSTGTMNGLGGGISNAGNGAVIIMASTIENNFAATTGGGFSDEANGLGTLNISNSLFQNNSAVGNGGGIFVSGSSATITSTTLQGNTTNANGGGLFDSGITLTVQSSTFAGNTASGNGGGIEVETTGTGATNGSTITNATITGNTALNNNGGNNGGGIDAATTFTGSLALLNDTINANFATNGGGVFWAATGGSTVTVQNTIIARNIATTGPDANNLAGTFTDNGGNLIGISGPGSGNFGFTAATTQTGTLANPLNPLLGVLQNNGGPTIGAPGNTTTLATEALLTGSPAIDKGVNTGVPATDERGFHRIVNNTVDVGAYEFQPPATTTALTSSLNPGTVGQTVTFQATVTATAPGSNTPTGTVTFFDGGRALATVTLTGGIATLSTKTLTPGTHRVTAVYNGLTVGDFSFAPSTSALVPEFIQGGLFAIGGAPGRVQVRRVSDGGLVLDFAPYGAAYTGPVSVALGDVNGDGFQELVTGATVGNPDVRVFDGQALSQGMVLQLVQFFPYALNFNVGANVAVGDISGNGFADVVTGATVGNPDVRVFSGKDIAMGVFNPAGTSLLAQFFPYGLNFNVGANVAVGSVIGDGFADLVTGATVGNPDVRVYNGKDIANKTFNPTGASLLAQFFAFGLNFNVGAFVAVGDTTGDGFGDIITGASAGNPQVKVFFGQAIAKGTFDPTTGLLDQFFAYNRLGTDQGVSVAAADFEGTGKADILTGPTQPPPNYRVVKGNATGIMPLAVNGIDAVANDITGGLLVGA